MTELELQLLNWFTPHEIRNDRMPVDWTVADFETFMELDDIRDDTGLAITIIREIHQGAEGKRGGAVDFISKAPIERVVANVLPRAAAIGIYAGHRGPSYHIDKRPVKPFNRYPRWMAVRPEDEARIQAFKHLIAYRTNEWLYFRWSHPHSLDCLYRVMQIAKENLIRSQII